MTARKRFKARVRARSEKTGEPYAVARRHLEARPTKEPNMPDTTATITDKTHGFTLEPPAGWQAVPRPITASHWQVASFSDSAGKQGALVLLPAGGQSAEAVAAGIRDTYANNGVEDVELRATSVAGVPAQRLETRHGDIGAVEHLVVVDDCTYRLALNTDDLDRAAFDAVAASLRFIDAPAPLPVAALPPARTDRALKVLRLATQLATEQRTTPTSAHLLYGLIAEGEGMGAVVLRDAGLDADRVRAALPEPPEPSDAPAEAAAPELDHLVRVDAPALAQELGNSFVGTEHLLLSLLRTDCPAAPWRRRSAWTSRPSDARSPRS